MVDGKPRIFIYDGNPDIRTITSYLLKTNGYDPSAFHLPLNTQEIPRIISSITKQTPDGVIVGESFDLRPKKLNLSGYQLAQAMIKQGIPVMSVTCGLPDHEIDTTYKYNTGEPQEKLLIILKQMLAKQS